MIHWRPYEENPYRGPPYLTQKPAVCGKTLPINYAEYPQFSDHVTCPVCLLIIRDEKRGKQMNTAVLTKTFADDILEQAKAQNEAYRAAYLAGEQAGYARGWEAACKAALAIASGTVVTKDNHFKQENLSG